jgi:phage tail-like protein
MPDLTTTFKFGLEFDGVTMAEFGKCSGFETTSEVIESKEATAQGRIITRKVPGTMQWSDITLERRLDTSLELYGWRQLVIDGDIDKARRNGSIVAYNSMGTEVARWNFTNGWPKQWKGSDFDASTNDIQKETVVIVVEDLVRA